MSEIKDNFKKERPNGWNDSDISQVWTINESISNSATPERMTIPYQFYSDLVKFRKIIFCLTRCEHGRVQGDICVGCIDGVAPSKAGTEIGFSLDGAFIIVIPERDKMNDPENWYYPNDKI